jgi:two-component system chemotaxis response regulator CheV
MNWSEIKSPPKATAATSYMTAVTEIERTLVQIIDVEKVMKEVLGDQERVDQALIVTAPIKVEQHILVADDSMVARKQVTAVLDQLGANYTECTNGKAALEQLRSWVAEGRDLNRWLALVISDIEMPLMDGYALAAEIRKDPAMKDLFVILHTSLSGVFNENLVRKVGANHFLSKYDANELARQVQKRLLEHAEMIGSGSD